MTNIRRPLLVVTYADRTCGHAHITLKSAINCRRIIMRRHEFRGGDRSEGGPKIELRH